METDRELLELAAKGAGVEVNFDDWLDGGAWVKYKAHGLWWNPLVSDGDALKLAVILHLMIDLHWLDRDEVSVYGPKAYPCERGNSDHFAAVRRCITRAAAAIGEQKGKGM